MVKPSIRVKMFRRPDLLLDLSDMIIAQHESDGENSLLSLIDMADMKSKTVAARQLHSFVRECNAHKQIATQKCDNALGIVRTPPGTLNFYVKASRTILLGMYKGREHMLGDHGFEVNKNNGGIKIVIPTNASKLIELAGLILAKHTADGANSLIKGLDIVHFTAIYNEAKTQHELATKLSRDKETAIGERNRLLGLDKTQKLTSEPTVRYYVTVVRDVLLGLKKGDESVLGDWGFDVNYGVHRKKVVSGEGSD